MHPPNPHHHPYTQPNPHFSVRPPPQQAPPVPPSLDETLSSLETLISLTTQTLNTLTQNYQITLSTKNDNLISCPFNSHHRIPPESLFSHSLRCPFPLSIDLPPRPDGTHIDGNFAYEGCPAVVTLPGIDKLNWSGFDLPSILIDQCGGDCGRRIEGIGIDKLRMLPSELWELRNEVAGWSNFPGRCSVSAIRAVLGGGLVSEKVLKDWVIVNSVVYGVVIDGYIRDCVFVLFRLCFWAIVKEASDLLSDWEGSGRTEGRLVCECPNCVEVLSWFASRLSLLYGDVNGKVFAVEMFKYVVLESASGLVLFDDKIVDIESGERSDETGTSCVKNVWGDEIRVDQVEVAIAALHKRSLLEEKIRALRAPRPLTRYERNAEHTYLISKAEEERSTRTNFRRIIDHDGLPRHYSSDQDSNKRKTREELLAEERDYKRRRMSYRGKKVKRSTLQVMRDIIEEYMDEIEQAGGIGCFEKGNNKEDFSQPVKPLEDVSVLGNPSKHRKEQHQGYDARLKGVEDDASRDYDRQRRRSHSHSENWEARRNSGKDRADKVHHYRSPERSLSRGNAYSHDNHGMEIDDMESTRKRYEKIKRLSPRRSKYRDDRSLVSSSARKGEKKLEIVNGKQRNEHDNYHSDYSVHDEFPDRYDPSESHDMQEDYVYTGRSYDETDKL